MKQFGPRFAGPKEAIAGTLALLALSPIAAGMVVGTIEYDWSAPVVEEAEPVAPISLKKCNSLYDEHVRAEERWLVANDRDVNDQGRRWNGFSASHDGQDADRALWRVTEVCDEWYDKNPGSYSAFDWVVKS